MSDPQTLLKVLCAQRHWRYVDFERHFNRAAERVVGLGSRNPSVSESQFRRWTAGQVKTLPSPDACRVLEDLFGVEVVNLLAPPPSTAVATPAFNLEDEIAMTARDAQSEAGQAAASAISDTTLDQARDDVALLARQYNGRAPFDVFRDARGLRELAEQLRERTAVPAQQQDLLIIAGQACALLSAAAFDLGSLDGATRFSRSAALYAETARFDPLRAFSEGVLAYIAYFTGRPADAARIARLAATRGGLGDVARRRLAAIEARAFGYLGDTGSAQRALDISCAAPLGRTDDLHDGVAGEFGFSEERLAMSNASTCLLLGDGEQAESAARRALELVGARPAGSRSLPVLGGAAADLAAARLLCGDLDGADQALRPLWTVPNEQRVTGLLVRAARLRRGLTALRFRGAALAGELGERIEDFTRSAGRSQLGTGRDLLPALEQ